MVNTAHSRWREKKRAEDPGWWQRRLAQVRELRKERGKQYEANRDHRARDVARLQKYPERMRAKWRNKGKPRPPCVVCGVVKVELHHPDYRLPDFVIPLCHAHHREYHWREKNEACHAG